MDSDTLGACGYHEGGKVTAWNNMELQTLECIRKCVTQLKGVTTADSGQLLIMLQRAYVGRSLAFSRKTENLEYYVNLFPFLSIDKMLRFIKVLCRQNSTLMWTVHLETLGLPFRSVVNHIS